MPRFKTNGISFAASNEWGETTEMGGPVTLTLGSKGVGALQFSLAFYEHGPLPTASAAHLLSMVHEFGETRGLGTSFDERAEETDEIKLGAASYSTEEDFVRVWYVSDGANFALVTYVCAWADRSAEISDVEHIVKTLRFEGMH